MLKLNYKCWVETASGEGILGEGKWKLLKAIDQYGSLKEASESMGYAYRQTWQNLKEIEQRLGFTLIEKIRGGAGGGHSRLTAKGRKLVGFFDRLYHEIEPEIQAQFDHLVIELNSMVDELSEDRKR